MYLLSLLSTASLALGVGAFLLPLEVADKAAKGQDKWSIDTNKQTVQLDCQSCPFALGGKDATFPEAWLTDVKNQLVLDFTLNDGKLNVNGAPIYPPPSPGTTYSLSAKQIASEPNVVPAERVRSKLLNSFRYDLPLSISIYIGDPAALKGTDSTMIIRPMSFEIVGIADKVVRVPTLHIRIATLPDGKTILLPIETTAYIHSKVADACTTILCRVRAVILSKIMAFHGTATTKLNSLRKGCMRKLGFASHRGGHGGHHAGPKVHGGVPKSMGKTHPGHVRHGRYRSIQCFLRRILHQFVLPATFGIFAGMAIGATSMFIYSVVSLLLLRFRRRGITAYASLEQDAVTVEEGRVSMDEPPKYETVYVEPIDDVIDEKKALL